jgi:hypothetical protein
LTDKKYRISATQDDETSEGIIYNRTLTLEITTDSEGNVRSIKEC